MKARKGNHHFGQYGLLGWFKDYNLNTTNDQAIKIIAARYKLDKIFGDNASLDLSLSLAAGGIYTAAAKGGVQIVAAAQVYTGLASAADPLSLTLATAGLKTRTESILYGSLSTAHGAPATCDLYVYGWVFDSNY